MRSWVPCVLLKDGFVLANVRVLMANARVLLAFHKSASSLPQERQREEPVWYFWSGVHASSG